MTTTVQRVVMVFGIIFILIGLLGFFTTGLSMAGHMDTAPRLLNIFPVNALHNAVHLLFGIWGVWAARRFSAAKAYAQISGVLYLVLAALAFLTPDLGGLLPIGGADIVLHAILGAVLAFFGFTAEAPAAPTTA